MKRWISPVVAAIGLLAVAWLLMRPHRGHPSASTIVEDAPQDSEPVASKRIAPTQEPRVIPLPPPIQPPAVVDQYAEQHERLLNKIGATPEERERAIAVFLHMAEIRTWIHAEMQRCLERYSQGYCQNVSHSAVADLVIKEHAGLVEALGEAKAEAFSSASAHEFDAAYQRHVEEMVRTGEWRRHFRKATPAELER